jgi:outer membrane lipoprotein-sorting protein/peroxiredoxin
MKTIKKWRNKLMNPTTLLKNALAMLLCAGVLCGEGVRVYAADGPNIEPQARAIIDNMASRYKAASSYSDVTSLNTNGSKLLPAGKSDEFKFRAQITWQRPNKAQIIKYADNGVARAVSDGKTLWAVTPRYKGYYLKRPANFNSINDAMNEIGVGAPGLGHIVEGQGVAWMEEQGLTSLKMGANSAADGVPVHLVIAHFEFPSGGSAVETLAVGTKDGLLHHVTQKYATDKGTLTVVETHTSIKLNPTLPDSTFAFAPPRGAKPIDYYSKLQPDKFKPSVKVGDFLPSFHAIDLNEKPVSLDDYKGKVVIIHFFATWEATAADVPEMVRLFNRYKDEGLAVVGVAMDARRERVTELITKEGVPYPVVFDGKGWGNAIAKLYGVHSLPTTLLVGRDGALRLVGGRPAEVGFEKAIITALANGRVNANE